MIVWKTVLTQLKIRKTEPAQRLKKSTWEKIRVSLVLELESIRGKWLSSCTHIGNHLQYAFFFISIVIWSKYIKHYIKHPRSKYSQMGLLGNS